MHSFSNKAVGGGISKSPFATRVRSRKPGRAIDDDDDDDDDNDDDDNDDDEYIVIICVKLILSVTFNRAVSMTEGSGKFNGSCSNVCHSDVDDDDDGVLFST